SLRGIAEAAAAGRLRRAAREDIEERALSIERRLWPEGEWGRHDPVENHGAHALGEAAQVVLRDARAVRGAVEVDALVAEGGAHALEILNRDARRVPSHLGTRAEVPEAAPRGGGDLGLARAIEQLLALGAAEPVRSPGPALVDEDEVALAPDARKSGSDRHKIGRAHV